MAKCLPPVVTDGLEDDVHLASQSAQKRDRQDNGKAPLKQVTPLLSLSLNFAMLMKRLAKEHHPQTKGISLGSRPYLGLDDFISMDNPISESARGL